MIASFLDHWIEICCIMGVTTYCIVWLIKAMRGDPEA